MRRFNLWLSEKFFSGVLGLLFAHQNAVYRRAVRRSVMMLFGRLIAPRYSWVISMYGDRYGRSLEEGLGEVHALIDGGVRTIVDCGAGTGFVSEAVARRYPDARVVGIEAVPEMLRQARERMRLVSTRYALVRGDTSCAPLRGGCADLVVAQNTTPFLAELGRLCRAGGVVLFTDSSARSIVDVATAAFRKTGEFDVVRARATESGFYVAARRGSVDGSMDQSI